MLINAGANQHVPELPEAAGGRPRGPKHCRRKLFTGSKMQDGCHLLQFNKLLSALDKGDQWERAELLLQRAGGLRLEPDMYSLGAGLSALARHRHWAGATSVLQWGQKEKLQSSEVIFNSLMSSCERSGRWKTAFDVFRTLYKALLQPSPASFSCWSRWPAAAQAISAIRQEGLQPSQINQGVAMKAFQLAELWQCALCLMQETWKGLIEMDQVTTSSAMTALERGRHWEMALHLSGPGADVVRLGAEAAAAAASGWLQALSWLRRAADLSLQIGVVAFGAILAACEKSGMWSLALRILRSMARASVEENTITCNSVLSACEKAGQWSAAVACLEASRSRTVATDALSRNAVISACEKAWHWRMATVLLPGSDEVGCNAAISSCEKVSGWNLAGAILCGMPWRRLLPTEVSHSSALTSYGKRQLWQGSLSLLKSMRRVLLTPNEFTYSAVLTACASPTTWQQAVGLLDDMRSDKVLPGGDLLVAVTSACSSASHFAGALDLLMETEEWLTGEVLQPQSELNSTCIRMDGTDGGPFPVFPSAQEGSAQAFLPGTDMQHPHESEPTKTAWIVDESDPRHGDVIVQTVRSADDKELAQPMGRVTLLHGLFCQYSVWSNVTKATFTVKKRRWGKVTASKDIVRNVSLSMQSGQTLAVMGPSGAGKTTFMDLLTLEGSSGSRTGYVDLNGKAMTPEVFKQYCAHVPQHDQGWPFLTCHETVQFAADFFLRVSTSERRARADGILETMGLQSCRHTRVGNEYIKGLSGGQRRRLSLAVAFMKNPLVVFLDEVTSGLDAASAASITKFLQELARSEDVIIACTIHQPSARIFKGFDKLLLLSGGRVAYSGQVEDAVEHFQKLGFSIPDHENPADFFLDSINADFTSQEAVEKVLTAWESQPLRVGSGSFDLDADIKMHAGQHLLVEVWVLFRRLVLLAIRDPTMYVSRMVVFLLSCIFFSIVYLKSRERTQTQILQRMWLLLWHIGVPSCMSLSTCLAQNMEFVAVKREVKSGMYRLSSYLIAQHLIQIPMLVVLSATALTISGYGMCGWNWDAYPEVLLVHSLLLFFFDCAAQLFAVTFSHPLLGLFQVICLWFASFLFAGVLVPEEDVVWPLRVFAIASPMKWSIK
ncbi:Abcg8, partial [Symbiodinium necroappetens]